MAKYETTVTGTIDNFNKYLQNANNHFALGDTATLEETIQGEVGDIKYMVLAFERFAVMGSGRSSLNVMMMEESGTTTIIATATGGSGGVFIKNH